MKKILVVDDDPDILAAVQMVLESDGYETDGITQAEQTFNKIDSFDPDLIILDVLLSGNDGRKICLKLKSDNRSQKIPIVMMSAHPNAKQSVNECGADSFVAKPFSIDDLLNSVKKLLN